MATDTFAEFLIDGRGSVISTGLAGWIQVPAGTITAVALVADQTGSIVVDLWKTNFAGLPATAANSITASTRPTLTSALTYKDTALVGWTTTTNDGDYVYINVVSVATVTRVLVTLTLVVAFVPSTPPSGGNFTLSDLRVEMTERMGFAPATGTFTNVSGNTFADTLRTESDGALNAFWVQDTTANNFPISRLLTWTQSGGQAQLIIPFAGSPVNGDSYELTANSLSFPEYRRAINSGLALCGKALRVLVRDETQTLTSNIYQYTPNYDPTSPNAFFPAGITNVSFLWWVGQPTRPFYDIPFTYIDDFTVQLPAAVVDSFAGDSIRFQGFGPVTTRITTDNPTQVIANIDNTWEKDMLIWACISYAWKIVAAKKTSGESTMELAMAQDALQQFLAVKANWRRGSTVKATMVSPIIGGWG